MAEYYILNKPKGCITARRDEHHKTVMDYFPEEKRNVLFPIGRLDKDTEGMLIVTDDGSLFYDLMKPEKHVSKTYFFWAVGEIDQTKVEEISKGVKLFKNREEPTRPATVTLLEKTNLRSIKHLLSYTDNSLANKKGDLTVVSGTVRITEGKKHQVKRMVRYMGAKVVYLKRIAIGELSLCEDLCPGEYRPLSNIELDLIKKNGGCRI